MESIKDKLVINYEVSPNSNEPVLTIHRDTESGLVYINTVTESVAKVIYQSLRSDNINQSGSNYHSIISSNNENIAKSMNLRRGRCK